MKQLLSFTLWEYTGRQIAEDNDRVGNLPYSRTSSLPPYVLIPENKKNKFSDTEFYFQFFSILHGDTNSDIYDKKYILFDVDPIGELMKAEFDSHEILGLIDDAFVENLQHMYINRCDDNKMPIETYVVAELDYYSSWTDCGYEYSMDMYLTGYLDSEMQLIKFEDK